jgi:hypothetical protein
MNPTYDFKGQVSLVTGGRRASRRCRCRETNETPSL